MDRYSMSVIQWVGAYICMVFIPIGACYLMMRTHVETHQATQVIEREVVRKCFMMPFPDLPKPPSIRCRAFYNGDCGGIGNGNIAVRYNEWVGYIAETDALADWALRVWFECGGD